MKLTVSTTSIDKPTGKRGGGRPEGAEWAEIAKVIASQTPGEWVTYKEYDGTPDALRVGLRLRQRSNFAEGKAFAPLKDKVGIAITDKRRALVKDADGKDVEKDVATLTIAYFPKGVSKKKAPAKKVAAKV